MNKVDVLKKILTVILESQPVSDMTINNDCSQTNNGTVNLIDDTEDIKLIKGLAREFAKALNDRDFESLDGRSEYHLYTVDHIIELINNNDEQNTINLFNENKIKSKYEDCEFLSITFSANQEQAEVVYKVSTNLLSAADKFFKELNKKNKNKVSKGTPFCTTYTLLVKKEKGIWKVNKFEAPNEN